MNPLIRENDTLIRKLILARDNGRCRVCGLPATDVHHLITRQQLSVRWYAYNLLSLCRTCHSYAHKERRIFNEKFKKYHEKAVDVLICSKDEKTDIKDWNNFLKEML